MGDSKIPESNTKEFYEWCVQKNMTIREIAEFEKTTPGTISKRMKKYGVTSSNPKFSSVSKNLESQGNMESQQNLKHVGSAGKNQGADHHPSSQNSSTPNPPALPSPKPEKLTEDYLEQYLIELSLIDKSPGTARLILDFLYKKQGLSPAPDGSDEEIDLSLLYKTQEDEYALECKTTKPETTDTNC